MCTLMFVVAVCFDRKGRQYDSCNGRKIWFDSGNPSDRKHSVLYGKRPTEEDDPEIQYVV